MKLQHRLSSIDNELLHAPGLVSMYASRVVIAAVSYAYVLYSTSSALS